MTVSEIMRESLKEMRPLPTGVVPQMERITGIRAVIFDLYGTLFISQTGDIAAGEAGIALNAAPALSVLLREYHISNTIEELACFFKAAVHEAHAQMRSAEPFPEIDAGEIWSHVLSIPADAGLLFAAAWEASVNKVWAMPGASATLQVLSDAHIPLGIVSNAQAYTLPLFPLLLGGTPEELGFNPGMCRFSWLERAGKPSSRLFELICADLVKNAIAPAEALFVGNDMLKDIYAARQAGLKTCLFAGDARSLKLRRDDTRCAFEPDAVIDSLEQLIPVIGG